MQFTESVRSKTKLAVSLITTLYNEEKALHGFLDSLLNMTVLPEEIVIVDGGSKDKTIEILQDFKKTYQDFISIKLIIDPTCTIYYTPAPIAKGRNIAIREAAYNIIAVTDAGCTVDSKWLEEICKPFFEDSETQFVAGWYEPLAKSYFEECQAFATFKSAKAVNPKTFLPSSRSVAFTKKVWKEVGGYPELALGGEDTLFDIKISELNYKTVFAKNAVVFWRLRPNLRVFTKLTYRYGFGDGFCRILFSNLVKNFIKLIISIVLLFAGIHYSPLYLVLLLLYLWLLPFNGNLREAFRINLITKYPTISFIKFVANSAYIVGYIKGLLTFKHPTFEKENDHQHQ